MKLDDIGFYTLSETRCKSASSHTPLWRAELILTNKCNFSCPYCRSLRSEIDRELTREEAINTLQMWIDEGLQNVRFSGGEPTIYPHLKELVSLAKTNNVSHIAISTNGSASFSLYKELIELGVNDFSISLDACCASHGDKMAGEISGAWQKVVDNIRQISIFTYVTVGVVVTEETYEQLPSVIKFADSLGVGDIRIIPSAQWNVMLKAAETVEEDMLDKYPILKYRVDNIKNDVTVRGLTEEDCHKCGLVLDDVASAGGFHFSCIIYMREGGDWISNTTDSNWRKQREDWYNNHNTFEDPICKKNCLDVCRLYNNKKEEYYK